MIEVHFIYYIGLMVVVAAAVLLLTRRLSIPSIVLYIFSGLLLGPLLGVMDLSAGSDEERGAFHALEVISESGIVLLLFLVGLELSFDRIRDVGKVAVAAGLGQVVFTAAIGFVISRLLGFDTMESIFLATALTFSSTVVVVKLLDQKGDVHALYGRIAVGIFLVQDLVVIVALTFLAGLADTGGELPPADEMAWSLGGAFGGMLLLLGAAVIAARWVLPRPFFWASRSAETTFVWSLTWCFGFVLTAEWLGLSPEIGAFLAGVSIAQLRGSHDVLRRVHPLMNFFIAIFFVTLGAQMQLESALDNWLPSLLLALFVLIGNPLIFMFIIARFGYFERTAFKTSVTVAQISEFSFIFAAMGLSSGLIGEHILSVVALVGLITIVTSAYMILHSDALYEWMRRTGVLRIFGAKQGEELSEGAPPRTGHVIVVGINTMARRILDVLHAQGLEVVTVDTDPRKLAAIDGPTLLGNADHLNVLEEAGIAHARLVISCLQIEDTNMLLAFRCEQFGTPCVIHSVDVDVSRELEKLGVKWLIDSKKEGMRRMRERVVGDALGGQP